MNGMDFAIWGTRGVGSTGTIVLLIDEDNSWQKIKISYLATARAEFTLGSFSAGTFLQHTMSKNGNIHYSYVIPNWKSQVDSHTVIVELAGVKTKATRLEVMLLAVSFSEVTGQITTSMRMTSSPAIESIVLTYIVFNNKSPVEFDTFNVFVGSSLPYQMIGMDVVKDGSAVMIGNGFTSDTPVGITCIGRKCSTRCILASACRRSQGTISGKKCYLL